MMIQLALDVGMALTVLTVEARADFQDGNQLYAHCTSNAGYDQGVCQGYVEGVVDHMGWVRLALHKPQCVPDGTKASQIRDVVKNYIRDQPQDRSYEASSLVIFAVTKAWNCK